MSTRLMIVLAILVLAAAVATGHAEYTPNPTWKIAFVRGSNLWVMKADGTEAKEIHHFGNITGRLSWSTDGKRIAYARHGQVNVQNPDGTGGFHKCYDLFVAHIDSAGKNFWWYITNDLGSTSPEWSADGQLFVYQCDLAANRANAILPEYRIFYRNWNGTVVKGLAPEDAPPGTYQGLQPTISPDNKLIAYVFVEKKGDRATDLKDIGMVIVPRTGIVRSEAELKQEALQFPGAGCPTFSPDGKTIAYINKDLDDNGIYLVNVADKTKRKVFTPSGGLQIRPNAISWSPDGQWLTFSSYDGNIYVVDHTGADLKQLSFGWNDYYPAFSR